MLIRTSLVHLVCSLLFMMAAVADQPTSPQEVDLAAYPREVSLDGGLVTVHHPVINDWTDFRTLSAWVAIEVQPAGATESWIGSVRIESATDVDFDERLVILDDIQVAEQRFTDGEPTDAMRDLAREAITLQPRYIVLDVLLRALPAEFEIPGQGDLPPTLNFAPPRIVVSNEPLQMMLIDGEPLQAPIEDTGLKFVVNTNWDVFHHADEDRWYVLNGEAWQVSNLLADGDWETTVKLPDDFQRLPLGEEFEGVRAALPAAEPEAEPVPFVISLESAELVLIDGEPELEAIDATGISYVTNSQSDLFEAGDNWYYLASGRWFTSTDLDGQWKAVGDLPDGFAQIPQDHASSHVLVSVPGTGEARAAMIEAAIPRRASVSVNAGQDLQVDYVGEPQFTNIEGTSLQRATNTQYQVILHNNFYYLCYNAVWYFSTSASGPWAVATSVPDEIYRIPASDPFHNVTYVIIEQPSAAGSEYVSYAYTGGYTGTYSTSVSIVYGTGWYYNPYSYWYPWGYPAYWWYPRSYGYGAWYNPATGRYGQRAVAYGPYGGAASTAVYNPRTGGYARGQSVWDNDELARRGYGYNPRSDTFAAGNMYYDFDDNSGWREGFVSRGDRWAYGETEIDGNRRTTDFVTSGGVEGTSTREFNDGTMTGSGTLTGENRSATTSSTLTDDGRYNVDVAGSEGGNVNLSGEVGGDRDISGTTAGGTDFTGDSQRTDGGRSTRLESESGGQAAVRREDGNRSFAGQTGDGDLYAGRNGNVYKKTDDGWSQYDNGGWSTMDRLEQRSGVDSRERAGSGQLDRGQYDRGQYDRGSFDRSHLDRQHNARRNGNRNYNSYQRQRGGMRRGGGRRR